MPKVFVVNRGCHDYEAAERYGKLTFLSEGLYNRFSTGKIYREFSEKLRGSNAGDFILISGLTVMTSVACSIFALKHKRVNLLLYNGANKAGDSYVKRTIKMEDL